MWSINEGKNKWRKVLVTFCIGSCHWFGPRKRNKSKKRAQVINLIPKASSSATCQSFLELIGKGSVPWLWSFSLDFNCSWINSHSLRWTEKIPETRGGLETTQRDFQPWESMLLYMSAESSWVSWHSWNWEKSERHRFDICLSLFRKESSCLNPGRTTCFQCASGRSFKFSES